MTQEEISTIREQAEQLYRNGDFYCSEALLKSVLEGFGEKVSHNTLAMASGFPVGIGGAECLCGALSGGIMALGYFFGRSQAKGSEVSQAMQLSSELRRRFVERNRVTCCRILTKGMTKGTPEHKTQCVRLTGEVTQDVVELIAAELASQNGVSSEK